jgi:hypothetical protein
VPPRPVTLYRYVPDRDSYTAFRARTTGSGAAIGLWQLRDAGELEYLSCAATGSVAFPHLTSDQPELGLLADAGEVYYVGVLTGPGDPPPGQLGVWEQAR